MSDPTDAVPTRSPTTSTAVRGVFRDRDALIRAVEGLAEKSVPADSVHVYVHDASGEPAREIPVEDESGALRGALIGAALGGGVGLLTVIAVATGVWGTPQIGILSFRGIAGALRAILGGAAAAVPLGALLGLGYWQGRKKISRSDFDTGTASVVVESDELSKLAERVLRDAGASDVATSGARS